MAINITTLKGTNSVSSDRITINDNFNILKDTTNDILSFLEVNTGVFTGLTNITTQNMTVSNDLTLTNKKLFLGNIVLENKNYNTFNVLTTANFSAVAVPKLTDIEIDELVDELVSANETPALIVFDSVASKFKGFDGTSFIALH